jgi:hypothetical protein
MPRLFGHGSTRKWSARQELHLRSLGPKPSMFLLHHALGAGGSLRRCMVWRIRGYGLLRRASWEDGGPEGICTLSPPADNGSLH